MRVNKTQALLYIFELLLSEGSIKKEDIMQQIEISSLTFKRYMQEIRAYAFNFYKKYELIYSRKDSRYILKKITID